jgi:PucR C-terminal helix-turn-helix domain/GGDEF-like domain
MGRATTPQTSTIVRPVNSRRRTATVRRLERSTGDLATAAAVRMESELPWYAAMSAADRSWVNLVAQAGIAAFVQWVRDPDAANAITADVFATAPRELVRAVSLQQTVDLVRTTIAVVEEHLTDLVGDDDRVWFREAILLYSREIAFAAAQVYARAAESRGAWDARLESLVLDALLRGEVDDAVLSRGAALGWGNVSGVCVIAGAAPEGDPDAISESIKRIARHSRLEALTRVQGAGMIVVAGNVKDEAAAAKTLSTQFGAGPIVVGRRVDGLHEAARSAQEAMSGLRAARGWPDAPRPVSADDLLAERALAGDESAINRLVLGVFAVLESEDPSLLETLSCYLERAGSLEGAARDLFVHPNTVRYRLRRVADLTGYTPTLPRDAWTLQLAMAFGRLHHSTSSL